MQTERSNNQIQSDLGIQDIIASISERRNVVRERLLSNRTRLLKALQKIKATHALVSYSGSGDSGQIDQVQIFCDNEVLKPKQNVRVLVASSYFNSEQSRWIEQVKLKTMSLELALEQLVYDWLEAEYAGWENNDGASGECTIEIIKGEFLLTHTTYYTESETTESSL